MVGINYLYTEYIYVCVCVCVCVFGWKDKGLWEYHYERFWKQGMGRVYTASAVSNIILVYTTEGMKVF